MEDKKIEESTQINFIQEDNLELEDIYPFITPEDEEELFKQKLLENLDEEKRNEHDNESNSDDNDCIYLSLDN